MKEPIKWKVWDNLNNQIDTDPYSEYKINMEIDRVVRNHVHFSVHDRAWHNCYGMIYDQLKEGINGF